MKIRRKDKRHLTYEVFPAPPGWLDPVGIFYAEVDFEPVPEEVWEDVTAQCVISSPTGSTVIHMNGGPLVATAHGAYRFRRVFGPTLHTHFVIERKKEAR